MLFTSVLTFGEIRKGIDLLPPGKKRDVLQQWLAADLMERFENSLLPVTRAISNRWGILAARSQQLGKPLGSIIDPWQANETQAILRFQKGPAPLPEHFLERMSVTAPLTSQINNIHSIPRIRMLSLFLGKRQPEPPGSVATQSSKGSLNMSTTAQQDANRENAQHSTGPITPEGKTASSLNHLHHGLSGGFFRILPDESSDHYQTLLTGLREEHHATTPTENILVEGIAQHHWLSRRAQALQSNYFLDRDLTADEQKNLTLYLRYQTTHERAFFKCLNELAKLRSETRKQQIGFEREKRCQDAHQARNRIVAVRARVAELDLAFRERNSARSLSLAELFRSPDRNLAPQAKTPALKNSRRDKDSKAA